MQLKICLSAGVASQIESNYTAKGCDLAGAPAPAVRRAGTGSWPARRAGPGDDRVDIP